LNNFVNFERVFDAFQWEFHHKILASFLEWEKNWKFSEKRPSALFHPSSRENFLELNPFKTFIEFLAPFWDLNSFLHFFRDLFSLKNFS
jgi:hypothetical protein